MKLLKQIETLFHAGTAGGLTDGQLLGRFLQRRDETAEAEAAFAALVDRHGAMVLRVCRQVLGDEHDAQDASQATFLVLARRAASIGRRESVASWLHGVALRVAARARLAAARRRERERRGGEIMAARHVVGSNLEIEPDRESWQSLHDELGRLPESFREPLVLCYLEGLTQEQAAAQLRCPLGTVQSRLARGRAKLKARLTKRGIDFSAVFPGAGLSLSQHAPAPAAWAESTVRQAMQFTQANGSGIAGAASAAFAEEVLRAMVVTKLKVALGMILCVAVLVSGAATWARQEREAAVAPVVAIDASPPKEKPEPEPPPQQAPAPPEWVTRTVRGTVRDEQGRPVAKAWFGSEVERSPDTWTFIDPLDRIRERKEPFRDEKGKIVLPGALGKYFEVRNQEGIWRPVHPADVRRYEKPQTENSLPDPFASVVPATIEAALAKGTPVFVVRTANGFWKMSRPFSQSNTPVRTDSEGNFEFEFRMHTGYRQHALHFASPDFTQRGYHIVWLDDPDKPLEITLKPIRDVHARVIVTPKDEPYEYVDYDIYTVDPVSAKLHELPAIGQKGGHWERGELEIPAEVSSPNEYRRLDVRLPAGRYKVRFQSDTVHDLADLVVPPGAGPLDLPDIHVRTSAWLSMLGKPAAEIEAVDVNGQPVKLADYRGKVIVLAFWSSKQESNNESLLALTEVQKRFNERPLAILGVHDASLSSLARFKKALAPLRNQIAGEIPIRFLLDRAPIGEGRRPPYLAGEDGSGRTADTYGIWGMCTFVIDKNGKMVMAVTEQLWGIATFAIGQKGALVRGSGEENIRKDGTLEHGFAMEALAGALEDLFGMPRSQRSEPKPQIAEPTPAPKAPLVVKGKVVDLEGRPISGAEIEYDPINKKKVKTGPTGDFSFTLENVGEFVGVKVEGPGLATRRFDYFFCGEKGEQARKWGFHTIEPSGLIPQPLQMSPGATVTGRVVHNGKPVAGVKVGIEFAETRDDQPWFKHLDTETDEKGAFRLLHVLPERDYWVSTKVGSLRDHGAVIPIRVRSGEDGSSSDLGELHVQNGRTLAGRVIFSDGNAPPSNLVLVANPENASGTLEWKLSESDKFEFKGLPDGTVSILLSFPGNPGTTRYHFSVKNKCVEPQTLDWLSGQLDHDIADLTILLEPGKKPEVDLNRELDPAVKADFNDAKAGPITGVPPADYPPK